MKTEQINYSPTEFIFAVDNEFKDLTLYDDGFYKAKCKISGRWLMGRYFKCDKGYSLDHSYNLRMYEFEPNEKLSNRVRGIR